MADKDAIRTQYYHMLKSPVEIALDIGGDFDDAMKTVVEALNLTESNGRIYRPQASVSGPKHKTKPRPYEGRLIEMLEKGMTGREIARALGLNESTVSGARVRLSKLGLCKSFKHGYARRVTCMDMDGNKIATYSSVQEAANAVGVDGSAICRAAKNIRKSSGGYRWKYAEE